MADSLQGWGASQASPGDPSKCVVLVPVAGAIDLQCESALRRLEALGYPVWRVPGYSQIDVGRNRLASDALAAGYEETLWIDSDIFFQPEDVERLRAHRLPIVCGIYPKKATRELACHVMPAAKEIVFGENGGLIEVLYVGAGFLLVRKQVYLEIARKLELPLCDGRFGAPMTPYFQPLVRTDGDDHWYLGEDYAFCERARQCGYAIMADTTIRLGHVGNYPFSWEDAGEDPRRFVSYRFRIRGRQA